LAAPCNYDERSSKSSWEETVARHAISLVEVHEFTAPVPGLGVERSNPYAVTNIRAEPGAQMPLSKFAVVVQTADGARGEYVGNWGATRATLGQLLMIAPFLLGRDALAREAIYDELKTEARQYDHMAHGHLDIALWDLAGKVAGMSVAQLLGGWRSRLPTYVSTYRAQEAPGGLCSREAFVDFAEACYARGVRAYKVHGWRDGNARREADNILNLARQMGDRMVLMLDPACELRTFADAVFVGRACDEAGCFWYEDPFRDSGVSAFAHRKLKEFVKTPLLMTEHVRGVEPKADFAIAGGTDFLRADPEYDMGITGTMKIAHFAEALGLDVELHAVGPAHRHCMAAIRNTNYYELALVGPDMPNAVLPVYACGYGDQLDDIGADGCVGVPTGAGLGVAYDWDFIARHRTALHRFAVD